jgi:hypothetical protein
MTAIALVDSGSDASFINAKFAIRSKCSLVNIEPVRITTANGLEMISDTTCLNSKYTVQGHEFTTDFSLLEVKGYDIILGADWIYTHSPVGLDLRRREFSITKNGQLVTFSDETFQYNHQVIGAKKLYQLLKKKAVGAVVLLNNSPSQSQTATGTIPVEIQTVLSEFADVFQEPDSLPPPRAVDHTIPLIEDQKPINQRAYRLPYHKKNAMEELIKQLLLANMIRPSVSPYSSPVILVKKKDGSWRLCVDYRKLNSCTIKNKYPISMIEDLLDELFGSKIFSKIDLRSGYHPILMREEDIHKTTFTTNLGHF